MTIIDMHTHLGDILNFGGGRTIFQKGVTKKGFFDLVSITEKGLYRTNAILEWFLQVFCTDLITRSCLSRNATATLENMQKAMKGNNVVKSVCLPVPPYVHFEDLKKAKDIGNFVVPFTGVDFSKDYDVEASFKSDVAKGAKGLKLHPIIQKEPLKSKKTYAVIETFSAFGLPVLFHSGVQSYYLGREKKEKQKPEYGKSDDALGIVKAFPDMIFIIGHAGIFQYREIMKYSCMPYYKYHVWKSLYDSKRII